MKLSRKSKTATVDLTAWELAVIEGALLASLGRVTLNDPQEKALLDKIAMAVLK